MICLYQDFITYEKEVSRVTDILLSLVYDASIEDKFLRKNTDIADIPEITLAQATALYQDITRLAKALSQNGNYAISVLGALLSIRAHLNEERIS